MAKYSLPHISNKHKMISELNVCENYSFFRQNGILSEFFNVKMTLKDNS
jgi:hypothetical protein